jgi:hypothetical protein
MIWAQLLAYVTGTVDQELLLRNVGLLSTEVRFDGVEFAVNSWFVRKPMAGPVRSSRLLGPIATPSSSSAVMVVQGEK